MLALCCQQPKQNIKFITRAHPSGCWEAGIVAVAVVAIVAVAVAVAVVVPTIISCFSC